MAGDRSAPGIHAELAALQGAVVRGDIEAREAFCLRIVPQLKRRLMRALPRLDAVIIEEAVHDTVLKYLRAPERYQPGRGHLLNWLFVAARNAALNLERKARRTRRHEVQHGLDLVRFAGPAEDDSTVEQPSPDWSNGRWVLVFKACATPAERRFILARRTGEGRQAEAQALGAAGHSDGAARRITKLAWDRIVKRVRRG